MKKAVILFNLGGPDSLESVEPFLFNLFNDPAILSLPTILRYPLAKLISKRRTPTAKAIYSEMGGSSPILEQTKMQALAIEESLKDQSDDYKCFIVMRCWNPRASLVIKEIMNYKPEQIILLPLYPQYSDSTSGSSIREWLEECEKNNITADTKIICCYPTEDNFILSHANLIREKVSLTEIENTIIIFSAHGLPESKIRKGDPYQWQVEKTVEKLVSKLDIKKSNYILSYQSRVGPLKWIGPSTDEVIVEQSKKKKTIVLIPIAFVSEHSETLVELDIEYKKLAIKNECEKYIRIPAVTCHKDFINSLKNSILKASNGERFSSSINCSEKFKKCPRISGI